MEVDDAALRALNIDPASWVRRENSKIQFFLHHKVVMLYICIYILALQLAGKAVNVAADVIKQPTKKLKNVWRLTTMVLRMSLKLFFHCYNFQLQEQGL